VWKLEIASMNRSFWMALTLAGAAFGPAACGDQTSTPVADPEAPAGVTVSDGRLMLPAVSGNPGAVYFDLANGTDGELIVRSASVAGAGHAMMHTTNETRMEEVLQVAVGPGETLRFEPGAHHLMVSDLPATMVPGGQAEVTLTFAGGDKVSFPADVRSAGDGR
jgi:copper(I)-binding protein